jgi:hypothetical protein
LLSPQVGGLKQNKRKSKNSLQYQHHQQQHAHVLPDSLEPPTIQSQPTLLQILFQQKHVAPSEVNSQSSNEPLSDLSWLQQQHQQQQQQLMVQRQLQQQEAAKEERMQQTSILLQHLFDSSKSLQDSTESEELLTQSVKVEQSQRQLQQQQPVAVIVKQEAIEVSVNARLVQVAVRETAPNSGPSSSAAPSLFSAPQHPFANFQLDFTRFNNIRVI